MSELFLFVSSNGNGGNFVLALKGSSNCVKQFTARTVESMSQHLGDEHLADIQENLINTEELPCDTCTKGKTCTQKHNFILIQPETTKQIFRLVSEEYGERLEDYMERED